MEPQVESSDEEEVPLRAVSAAGALPVRAAQVAEESEGPRETEGDEEQPASSVAELEVEYSVPERPDFNLLRGNERVQFQVMNDRHVRVLTKMCLLNAEMAHMTAEMSRLWDHVYRREAVEARERKKGKGKGRARNEGMVVD